MKEWRTFSRFCGWLLFSNGLKHNPGIPANSKVQMGYRKWNIHKELNTLLRDHVLISFNFFLVDGCSALTAFLADDKSFFSSWLLVTASGLVMSRRTDCTWHSHHVHLSRAMWEKQWQRLPKHANYIKLQHGNLDMQTKRRHFCRHLLQELFWNAKARTPTSPRDKIPSCRAQEQVWLQKQQPGPC